MRRCLALSIFLLLLGAPSAKASIPPGDVLPTLITVYLDRGDTLVALAVEPAPYQIVRITTPDGTYRYVSTNHVLRILDGDGADRTRDVLERRKTVGKPLSSAVPQARPVRPIRVGPRSVTKAFTVTEASLLGRIDPGGPDLEGRRWYYGFDFGREENVSARMAVGWSAFLGSGNDYADFGLRARFRRWLGPTSSLEFAPGLILAQDEHDRARGDPPGFAGRLSWSTSLLMAYSVDVFSVRRNDTTRETGLMLGIKIGGTPGAAGGALASAVALAQFVTEPTFQHGGFAPTPNGF